jgi:hypothetical protein
MRNLPLHSDDQVQSKNAATRERETALSRIVMLFIGTGLAFMLLPGTFLGVWNLLSISSKHAADSISAPWIQVHGHAQVFGWIGTFILGIGFYSIPRVRSAGAFALGSVELLGALDRGSDRKVGGERLRMALARYPSHLCNP